MYGASPLSGLALSYLPLLLCICLAFFRDAAVTLSLLIKRNLLLCIYSRVYSRSKPHTQKKSIRRAILRNLRLFPFFGLNVQPWPPASARQPSDLKMKSSPSIFPMPGHAQNSPMELFLSLPCCFTTCSQIFSDAYYVFTLTRHQKLKEKIQELYCTLTNQCQMKQA